MIKIVTDPIDHGQVIRSITSSEAGAVVTFDGVVRNHARGKPVTHLFYECYPKMATKEMGKIRDEAFQKWPLEEMSIIHRLGRLEIGESSVFIAVASPHRDDAFNACWFSINALKTSVPIWKKEYYENGEIWIEGYGS